MSTSVKVLSSCKSILPSQFLGPQGRTCSQNDLKVRLVVKKYDNFKQIPTFKWKSKIASEPILGIILRIYSVEVNNIEHKNDRKVRLVVKKYDNFKQIPTFKWKSNNND